KDDKGTWLHEHLHALGDQQKQFSGTQVEKVPSVIDADKIKESIKNKDIAELRKMSTNRHFYNNTLPELYVQDEIESEMKDRGFETRKDPIKSRFKRLKRLMKY